MTNTTPKTITADLSVPEIVAAFPQTADVFAQYGIHTAYKALEFENLVATSKVHQVDVDALLHDLNAVIG
jgi:hypothetical protein